MKTLLIIAAILLMACNNLNTAPQNDSLPALPDELRIGRNALSRDTVPAFSFPTITDDQRMTLQLKSGLVVPDSTMVIGSRKVNGNCTLEAYLVPSGEIPSDFKIYLTTRGSDGYGIHTIELDRFHTCQYQGKPRLGGNRYYTTDAELRFDGDTRFTLHRVMTLTSIFLKDHSTHEMWRVEWDNLYEIDASGHIIFIGQQETLRSPADLDDPVIDQYMSHDRQSTK